MQILSKIYCTLLKLHYEYPELLIISYSISISETTLFYLVYFVFALRKASIYVLNIVFVAPTSMLSPYCLYLGGLQGGKFFLDADSWDIPGGGLFWLRPKNVTTDFPPMRFFLHINNTPNILRH